MTSRLRQVSDAFRSAAVLVALVSQLALGAMVLPDIDAATASDAVAIFCTGTTAPDPGAPSGHAHWPAPPALCPLGIALALPSIVPTPAAILPLRTAAVLVVRPQERPPGRGPPAPTARVGIPRAPPLTA
ncbi:MAG TPA: hypothetical protein VHS58_16305 [Acetobacteraceae bacterium]|jgi:hypothetical protein|nr:hypothetical protein [Acetobacteraceae bacterium]